MKTLIRLTIMVLAGLSAAGVAHAGAYIGSSASQLDFIMHPTGYTGASTDLSVKVCITPGTPNASAMEIPVQNTITVWNAQNGTTDNLKFGDDNNIPQTDTDFESVALHELGHCIGLGHTNIGSILPMSLSDYAASTAGSNSTFDLDDGADDIQGSADDQRGDDLSLLWYRISDNNPCTTPPAVIDSTTYARDPAQLPGSDSFPASSDRAVCAALGLPNTEAVMNQLTFNDEDQRDLAHDDVATIRYAQSGLDEIANTSDDYTYTLEYGGISNAGDCDINIAFDNTQTSFATCAVNFTFPDYPNDITHGAIITGNIFMNTGTDWFFNPDLIGPNTEPALVAIPDTQVMETQTVDIALSSSDSDGDGLTLSQTGLPGFCTLSDNGDGSGNIACAPAIGDAGISNVTVTVTDDGIPNLSNEQSFMLTVTAALSDMDEDGIPDDEDNCKLVPNADQSDPDSDGFGTPCDGDLNNDCGTDFLDLAVFKGLIFGADPVADFDGSGGVDFLDLGILKALFFMPPGPSGVSNICEAL